MNKTTSQHTQSSPSKAPPSSHHRALAISLFSMIAGRASANDSSSEVVAMVTWLYLSSLLPAQRLGCDTLLKAAYLDAREAPEGLH